jgi:hypothetical protein
MANIQSFRTLYTNDEDHIKYLHENSLSTWSLIGYKLMGLIKSAKINCILHRKIEWNILLWECHRTTL